MRRSICNDKCVPHFSMDRKSPVHHQHLMALPVTGCSVLKQYPPACHCPGGNAVWHRSEWAQGAPGRKFCSGSVSYFCDLYFARTIPGCLLPLHPLPCCVFPTLCVWTVKEIYLKTSGTKHHGLKVCLSVCVCLCVWEGVKMNSISFVWMGCLFRYGAEDCISAALQTWHKVY